MTQLQVSGEEEEVVGLESVLSGIRLMRIRFEVNVLPVVLRLALVQ